MSDLNEKVDKFLELIKPFPAKFNRERTFSVIDLGERATHSGTFVRQVMVYNMGAYLEVSIREGFKGVNQGIDASNRSKKPLASFNVPISDVEAYDKINLRFFNVKLSNNVGACERLNETLEDTLTSGGYSLNAPV